MLFTALPLRHLIIRNRVFVSPMCQYSGQDGFPSEWHLVHLGSRAVGGAGLVLQEATAVSPEGRISAGDLGIWSDAHAERLAPVVRFIQAQGAAAGIQLAHAGRKASTAPPWTGGGPVGPEAGGWTPVAPSAVAFDSQSPMPHELTTDDLDHLRDRFVAAAGRSAAAGYQVVEIHAAHGYLLHQFLSPLSNRRTDRFGGTPAGRMRYPLSVVEAVRGAWPEERPLLVRVSATDYLPDGWTLEDTVVFARELKRLGVDLVDCSSGGLAPESKPPVGPGYQVPFSATVRQAAGVATAAVGLITEPWQAETILATGQADAVLLGRELLRDPYWPLHAARRLGADLAWPVQYARAR